MTHIPLTDADLIEIETLVEDGSNVACMCVASYHAPRLIAEVRAFLAEARSLRMAQSEQIRLREEWKSSAQMLLVERDELRRQLSEAKEKIERLELQRDKAREIYDEMRGNMGFEIWKWRP